MRDGWQRLPLGSLVKKRTDFVPVIPDQKYTILGVQRSGWGFVEREPIKGSDQKFSKLMQVSEDDLVYRTITAFEAPAAVVGPREAGKFVTPQTFPVFRIDQTRMLPRFMEALTTWPSFHEEMSSRCTGSVLRRKTLSTKAFESIPIALPPLDAQRRIVDLLSALDETIAAAERRNQRLDAAESSARARLWTSGTPVRLQDLGRLLTGSTPSTKNDSFWSSRDVPFVTPGDVPWGGQAVILTDIERRVSRQAADESTRRLDGPSVLQVCIGATVGKTGFVEGQTLFNQQINAVTGMARGDARVLSALLASPQFQHEFRSSAGSSTMPLVSKGSWGAMEVRWPQKRDRRWWSDILDMSDGARRATSLEIHCLRDLRSNLLTALLSGEHEIPESYDRLMEDTAA